MRRTLLMVLAGASLGVAMPQAQSAGVPAAMRQRIDAIASEIRPQLVATRRDLHQHPELGFRETRTAGIVADRLRALKFDEVRTGVGGTGVIGTLKGGRPGKTVMIRADMDALPIQELNDSPYKSQVPNVKHACGHDGHTSILLGVADVLSRMRADIPGTVLLLFQPAEEGDPDGGTTGAIRVIEDGGLKPKPDAIFGLHLDPQIEVGRIGVRSGPAMASASRFTLKIIGKQTHGAMPHTGNDPIPMAAEIVSAFQTIPARQIDAQQPTVLTVGSIHGGNRYNVVADSVTMEGTVRTFSQEGPEVVKTKMAAILKGITSAYGATYTFDYFVNAPVTYNDPGLAAPTIDALRAAFGDAVFTPPLQMVAEDFSYYQQQIPGFYFFVGVKNEAKGITALWHTEYYEMDEDALPVGVRALSNASLAYLFGNN
jgi:amidohydrolase